jgi:hypothetical protein
MSHRTQITFPDDQYARLKGESERSGLSMAQLLRRAVSAVGGDARRVDTDRGLDASFGAWRDRDFDGETYVEELGRGMMERMGWPHPCKPEPYDGGSLLNE